jgi:dienelactone hydrolase
MNKDTRREFLKLTGMSGLTLCCANIFPGCIASTDKKSELTAVKPDNSNMNDKNLSIIGLYGPWATTLIESELPRLSYRRNEFQDIETWRTAARKSLVDRLAVPRLDATPKVTVKEQFIYDGLHIEKLTWQLPYGRPTEAVVLKPVNAKGPLPGILAFHDHGSDKFHGYVKIVQTSEKRDPLIVAHQKEYYSNRAWANEIAKRGYVVMVSDAFDFASRRVKLSDVPSDLRNGLDYRNDEDPENIMAYNKWAAEHEHVMAKSLLSAGTTWPGVFFAEDQKALDILCERKDVDAGRIGCAGLSGGGIRTHYMAAMDPRIKCAVPVGFTTTWKDMVMYKSFTHTWMAFIPLIASDLNFPEIIGIRVPMPILILNNTDDPLFDLSEMKEANNVLGNVYKKANAEEHYKCSFYPGVHKFEKDMQEEAFDWFDRWLKA